MAGRPDEAGVCLPPPTARLLRAAQGVPARGPARGTSGGRRRVAALKDACRSRWSAARRSRSWARTARASRRWSGSCRRCCCTTAEAHGLRPRRLQGAARGPPAREPRLGRGLVLQEDVGGREPLVRGAVLRHDRRAQTRAQIPRDPRAGRLPADRRGRADGEPLARHAAEGRARARAADLAGAAAAGRADDGARPALEARGAGLHPRDPRRRTTRRSCSARTTSPRRRCSPTGSGSSTAASCSRSSPPTS